MAGDAVCIEVRESHRVGGRRLQFSAQQVVLCSLQPHLKTVYILKKISK